MMFKYKNRQNKLEKLQQARRAYIEQLAFIRRFKKDEDGGLIVLTLLLLISMLVVGGMAVDFMRFESERTKLQSVSDRAVLAAANLNQERDAGTVLTDFFTAEGYEDAIVGEPFVQKTANGSEIRLASEVDMDTFYLRLVGMDTLTAPATASAIEGTGNVEVSLVLDISGSMGSSMTGQVYRRDSNDVPIRDADGNIETFEDTRTRMFFLQQAANQFVEDLLLPEYEDRISINLIAYSQHVRLGNDLYMALRTTPDSMNENDVIGSSFSAIEDGYAAPAAYIWVDADGNEVPAGTEGATLQAPWDQPVNVEWAGGFDVYTNPSRCVTFEDDEYETLTFDTNRVYEQVEWVDFYSRPVGQSRYDSRLRSASEGNFVREPCSPEESHGIILLSQDIEELQTAINSYYPTENTSIHRGMKWGVSLLDPSMRDLLGTIQTVDDAFRGTRPANYTDRTTSKYVVIMTDGETVSSERIIPEYYDEYDERLGLSETPANYYPRIDDDPSTNASYGCYQNGTCVWFNNNITESIGSVADLNEKLSDICDLAGDQVTEVYTISMGLFNETMTDCASKDGNAFRSTITNDPGEPGLDEIFRKIAEQITALRLAL
ncbi:Tad domain-containing protein [Yoonia algicola]|uniref:Tad domain-containing protein n=1 Tax=Yoonia algicola TaxID=3137368 RepID=A0AAN0LYW2_9RHOB